MLLVSGENPNMVRCVSLALSPASPPRAGEDQRSFARSPDCREEISDPRLSRLFQRRRNAPLRPPANCGELRRFVPQARQRKRSYTSPMPLPAAIAQALRSRSLPGKTLGLQSSALPCCERSRDSPRSNSDLDSRVSRYGAALRGPEGVFFLLRYNVLNAAGYGRRDSLISSIRDVQDRKRAVRSPGSVAATALPPRIDSEPGVPS